MLSAKTKIFLIILGIFCTFTGPLDPDFGWHYKLGEYITQNREIPTQNIYSYSMPNYKWVDSYWLPQVIIYTLYSNLGYVGAGLLLSFFYTTTMLYLINKFEINSRAKILMFGVLACFIPMAFVLSVRPMLFSTIFLLIELHLLLNRKFLFFLPLLFIVWTNTHADFLPGVVILVGITVYRIFFSKIWNSIKNKMPLLLVNSMDYLNIQDFSKTEISLIQITLVTIASFLATFLNPSGVDLWKTLAKEANPVSFKLISEMLPFLVALSDAQAFWYVLLIMFFSGLLLASVLLTIQRFPLWLSVLSLALFLISIRSKYFLRLFTIFSIIQCSVFWTALLEKFISIQKYRYQKALKYVTTCAGVFSLAMVFVFFAQNIYAATDVEKWSEKYKYPYKIVQIVKEKRPNGNMFNTYDWGGYLIFQMPEYKTFADGRMASWNENGKYILEEYSEIYSDPEKNKELLKQTLQKNNVGFVVDKKDSVFSKYILETGEWNEVYSDKISILLFNKALNP